MRVQSKGPWWLGPAVFTGLGLVFVCVGAGILMSEVSFGRTARKAEGVVVELIARTSRGKTRSTVYAPAVEFQANGKTVKFVNATASSPPEHEVGERVPVLFDPARPENATIDTWMSRFFLPTIFLILGSLFAAIGGGIGIAEWRKR
jgi:hypothetical protein